MTKHMQWEANRARQHAWKGNHVAGSAAKPGFIPKFSKGRAYVMLKEEEKEARDFNQRGKITLAPCSLLK